MARRIPAVRVAERCHEVQIGEDRPWGHSNQELVCFVDKEDEQLDVDLSAHLFSTKGAFFETVGYNCPVSTDGGVKHKHDSVQLEAGTISEDIEFDLSLVHKRVYAICLVATTYGTRTFANLQSLQLRILESFDSSEESRQRETTRVAYTRDGCLGQKGLADSKNRKPNALVLGDLRRVLNVASGGSEQREDQFGQCRGGWELRAPNVMGASTAMPQEVIPILQFYLREWIPSIEVAGQELLVRRVYDIVSLLPVDKLGELWRKWATKGGAGATKEQFLRNTLRVLLGAHAALRDERQRVELTSLLCDLFDQISGTRGNGRPGLVAEADILPWEQFTTFWVEAATINTHSEDVRCWADETLQWVLDPRFEMAVRKPSKLISLPLMHVIVGLEERASFVSILNGATGRQHVMLCPSTLQSVAQGATSAQESFVTVLDVECIDAKGLVIISSTDYAISVWHYNLGSEQALWRFSFHSRFAQILVSWVAHEGGFLVSAGVDHTVTAWCVDKQLRLAVMNGHHARVTDVTYLSQHGQFATSSFDKTVRLWNADQFKPVAELDHRNPVKFVRSHGDLILCVTLELEAHVTSVTTRSAWCRMIGHRHQIIGAELLHFIDARQGGQTRAITGDAAGDFYIWDVGNGRAKDGCAEIVHTFAIYNWRPTLGEVFGFERIHRHQRLTSGGAMVKGAHLETRFRDAADVSIHHVWPDIVVRALGGTLVIRTRQLVKDARPVSNLAYNDKSMDLIASTGQHVRFWDIQTSDPLRKVPSPFPQGITCLTIDSPDPRRIYLGSFEGGIAVVHIVTGQLLFEIKDVHSGAIVSLVVCPSSGELISIGIDRRVIVHRETAGGLGLAVVGVIEEAHATTVSACAVSPELQLIATAAAGEVRLWHKTDFTFQGGICDLDADVIGLVFLPGTSCLFASDSCGDIVLWVVEFGANVIGPSGSPAMAARSSTALCPEKDRARPDSGRSTDRSAPHLSAPAWDIGGLAKRDFQQGQTDDTHLLRDDKMPCYGTGIYSPRGEDIDQSFRANVDAKRLPTALHGQEVSRPVKLPPKSRCVLRVGALLSSGQADRQQQIYPAYEIHLHWVFEKSPSIAADPEPPRVGGVSPAGRGLRGPVEGEGWSWTCHRPASYQDEQRRSLMVVSGSAGGWVNVWRGDDVLAKAGVDENAMKAALLRRQQRDERGSIARGIKHRRSGLGCSSMSAAKMPRGCSVKSKLDKLPGIPPAMRWEAHRGSPVSSMCPLPKTPLLITASTDSTLRLFTLTDIQVGARQFKATESLGEIDLRDTESVRIDRAEMWSCPSLSAADVKSIAEIDYYRGFSDSIRAELEGERPVSQKSRAGDAAAEHCPDASVKGRRTPNLVQETSMPTEQRQPEKRSSVATLSPHDTFLTSLQRVDREFPRAARRGHTSHGVEGDASKHGQEGCPADGIAPGSSEGSARVVHAGFGRDKHHGGAPRAKRRYEIAAIVSAATAAATSAASDESHPGCDGSLRHRHAQHSFARRWGEFRHFSERKCAAKNHMGKVMYGNMYSELKSGGACNTLVTEYLSERKKRGDCTVDVELTPFLREKLPPIASAKRVQGATGISIAKTGLPKIAAGPEKILRRGLDGEQSSRNRRNVVCTDKDDAHDPRNDEVDERHAAAPGSCRWKCEAERADLSRRRSSLDVRSRDGKKETIYLDSLSESGRLDRQELVPLREGSAGVDEASDTAVVRAPRTVRGGTSSRHYVVGARKDAHHNRVVMSASLMMLPLGYCGNDQDRADGNVKLETGSDQRPLFVELDRREADAASRRLLRKSASLPPPGRLQEQWRHMQERFDDAVSSTTADDAPTMIPWNKLKSQAKSAVGEYIRRREEPRPMRENALQGGRETDENLLSTPNFGTYSRSEVETLGSVFLSIARKGMRFTYDQWRKALMVNKGVSILRGLQFGMLDEDNDGEVSLGDISRAVFRRAADRDLARIRRFLELWLTRERRKYHHHQARKAFQEQPAPNRAVDDSLAPNLESPTAYTK